MRQTLTCLAAVALGLACVPTTVVFAADAPSTAVGYAAWKNGPSAADDYFPIAVWLQSPRNADKYKAIGVNLYLALWRGPTAEQLSELENAGMPVICSQNAYAREHLERKIIIGWMHGDEPDNAQSLGRNQGYGPPIPPDKIVADYERIRKADPSRPVLLNLGQGVAWDGWHGRGVRTNHPEDYPLYARGSDIVSFDIYPVVHDRPEVAGKLWFVPKGVKRLRDWTDDKKIVWNCIECTRISNRSVKPTPAQVKAEVWMSLIHGSRGLIYFCHQFEPTFIEAGLLADQEMVDSVRAINQQIHELARVLNGPAEMDAVRVEADPPTVSSELKQQLGAGPVATMVKRAGAATYLFAVRMEASPAKATFHVKGIAESARATTLGENRAPIDVKDGTFIDDFGPHEVHLYRIE